MMFASHENRLVGFLTKSVTRTRPAGGAEVLIMSGANLFLLFIGKDRTTEAAARGAEIWSENVPLWHNHS